MISVTVILKPFQSLVAVVMLLSTFFGDRPRGLISGAQVNMVPTSPISTPLMYGFYLVGVKFRQHGGGGWLPDEPGLGMTGASWLLASSEPKLKSWIVFLFIGILETSLLSNMCVYQPASTLRFTFSLF